jgi:hypothetical protein
VAVQNLKFGPSTFFFENHDMDHVVDHKRNDNDGVHPLLILIFITIVEFFDQFFHQI